MAHTSRSKQSRVQAATLSMMDYDGSTTPPTFRSSHAGHEPNKVVAGRDFLPGGRWRPVPRETLHTSVFQAARCTRTSVWVVTDASPPSMLARPDGYDANGASYLPYGSGRGHLDYEPSCCPCGRGILVFFTSRDSYNAFLRTEPCRGATTSGQAAKRRSRVAQPAQEDLARADRPRLYGAAKLDPSHPASLPARRSSNRANAAFVARAVSRQRRQLRSLQRSVATASVVRPARRHGPILQCVPAANACSNEMSVRFGGRLLQQFDLCINKRAPVPAPEEPRSLEQPP